MGMECVQKPNEVSCTSDPNCQWTNMDEMAGAVDPMAGIPKCVEDCSTATYPEGAPDYLLASCDAAKAFLATCTACTAADMTALEGSFMYSMICPNEAKGHGGRRALRARRAQGSHDHDAHGASCISKTMAGAMSGFMDSMVKPMMQCAMQ